MSNNAGYSGNELIPVLVAGTVVSGTNYAEHASGNVETAPADGSSAPAVLGSGAAVPVKAVTTGNHGASH